MLWTPQSIVIPAHYDTGVAVSRSLNYEVPGIPVTPLPKPTMEPMPMHRVNARTMQLEMPVVANAPTESHPLTIHFGFNRWKLNGNDKAKLFALPISSYEVTGYASPPGSKAYNLKLSRERAKSAARFLKQLGSKVSYKGVGAPPGMKCSPYVLPQNCRPELREDKVVITRISPRSLMIHVDTVEVKPHTQKLDIKKLENSAHTLSSPLPHPLNPLPTERIGVPVIQAHTNSFYSMISKDKALWKKVLLYPGDLKEVARQLQKVSGYTVQATGPTIALHDMGMPWLKTVPVANVLHKLHKQAFIRVQVDSAQKFITLSVDLNK